MVEATELPHDEYFQKPPEMDQRLWDSVVWLRDYGPQLVEWSPDKSDNKPFQYLTPVVDVLINILHPDLSFNPESDRHQFNAIAGHFAEASGVSPGRLNDVISEFTVEKVDTFMKRSNPQEMWWQMFIEESKLNDEGSIDKKGGSWRIIVKPDMPSVTHGAEELQQTGLQWWLEMSANAREQATKPLAYHPNPPSVEGREELSQSSDELLKAAEAFEVPCQKQEHLSHIHSAASAAKINREDPEKSRIYHKTDAMARIVDGETFYRSELRPEQHRVRIFRAGATKEMGYYIDLPIITYLEMDKQELQKLLEKAERWPETFRDQEWKYIDVNNPPDSEDPPAFSVSAGEGASPNNIIYHYARRGDSMLHAHYNTETHRMELYWNHVPGDGGTGKQMSFGIGYALQQTDVPPEKRQNAFPKIKRVELFPFIKGEAPLSIEELETLKEKLEVWSNTQPYDYRDDELLIRLTRSLGIRDLAITPELIGKDYGKALVQASEVLNEMLRQPKIDLFRQFMAENMASVSSMTQESQEFFYDMISLRMNPQRITDLVAEANYGPLAVCVIPHLSRLTLTLIPEMNDILRDQIADFFPNWEGKVDNLRFMDLLMKDDEMYDKNTENMVIQIQNTVFESLGKLHDLWTAENTLGMLDMGPIPVSKMSATEWRDALEFLASNVSEEMYRKLSAQAQRSDVAGNILTIDGIEVELESFMSAMASRLVEKYLSSGLSSFTQRTSSKDSVTMQPMARHDLSVAMLEAMSITYSRPFQLRVERVFEDLALGMGVNPDDLMRAIDGKMHDWWEINMDYAGTAQVEDSIAASNALIVTNLLLRDAKKNMSEYQRKVEFCALQTILVSGAVKMQEDFLTSLKGTARELPVFMALVNERFHVSDNINLAEAEGLVGDLFRLAIQKPQFAYAASSKQPPKA